MFERMVQHMEEVGRTIEGMRPTAAFAFALACTERQWPVFQRASHGRSWARPAGQSSLRHGVDAAWTHWVQGTSLPHGLASLCAGEVPRPEDIVDALSAAAHTIANSIVDLLDAVEKHDTTYPHHLSGTNLGLLEMLMDEVNEQDTRMSRAVQELVEREIAQQTGDSQTLGRDSSSYGVEEIRRASAGKNLFGHVWFNNEGS